jgi:hypothetical protein
VVLLRADSHSDVSFTALLRSAQDNGDNSHRAEATAKRQRRSATTVRSNMHVSGLNTASGFAHKRAPGCKIEVGARQPLGPHSAMHPIIARLCPGVPMGSGKGYLTRGSMSIRPRSRSQAVGTNTQRQGSAMHEHCEYFLRWCVGQCYLTSRAGQRSTLL